MENILTGTGWTVDDQSNRTDVQEIADFSGTLVEAITEVVSVWANDLGVQYDNAARVVHLYSAGQRSPTGAYLTEDLNLLEAPQVRSKTARGAYYNRLYLIGADGLMLPGDHYVENRTADAPIVSHVETNEDLSDAAALLATAQQMVAEASHRGPQLHLQGGRPVPPPARRVCPPETRPLRHRHLHRPGGLQPQLPASFPLQAVARLPREKRGDAGHGAGHPLGHGGHHLFGGPGTPPAGPTTPARPPATLPKWPPTTSRTAAAASPSPGPAAVRR